MTDCDDEATLYWKSSTYDFVIRTLPHMPIVTARMGDGMIFIEDDEMDEICRRWAEWRDRFDRTWVKIATEDSEVGGGVKISKKMRWSWPDVWMPMDVNFGVGPCTYYSTARVYIRDGYDGGGYDVDADAFRGAAQSFLEALGYSVVEPLNSDNADDADRPCPTHDHGMRLMSDLVCSIDAAVSDIAEMCEPSRAEILRRLADVVEHADIAMRDLREGR